jgi:hypothetical protein
MFRVGKNQIRKGLDILHQGVLLAVQEYPLPFVRRTVLEFVLPENEGLSWWDSLCGLCAGFGLRVGYLVFNPNLEYRSP